MQPPTASGAIAPNLRITVETSGTVTTVALAGEIDVLGSRQIDSALRAATQRDRDVVVVDLEGVTFIETTGVAALVAASRRARERPVRLVLLPGPASVQGVLALCGVLDRFDFATALPGAAARPAARRAAREA